MTTSVKGVKQRRYSVTQCLETGVRKQCAIKGRYKLNSDFYSVRGGVGEGFGMGRVCPRQGSVEFQF